MAKVFLSHSSYDKDKYIREIANELIDSIGIHSVIYDEVTFEEGMMSIEEIEKGLEKTDLFVIFLSDKSLDSEWVKFELTKANLLNKRGLISRIYPIIIDDKITYSDKRIPKWMRDVYNIKLIRRPKKAFKMIKQRLLEINWENYPRIKERAEIFVGRNDYIKSFEERFYSIDEEKVNVVIASGMKNIGRKSLMNKCFRTVNAITENSYEMSTITLTSLESLEDFIFKIYDLGFSEKMIINNLINMTIEEKIQIAIKLIKDIQNNKEIIHIEDRGGIVTHKGKITEWFLEIVQKLPFKDRITFAITSKFRIFAADLWKYNNIYSIQVGEFNKKEIIGLLSRYLQFEGIELETEDFKIILDLLTGYPEQVAYAVYLIKKNGINWVKSNAIQIVEFNKKQVLNVLKDFEEEEGIEEFLVLLCNFDYIGYDFIFEIVGNSEIYKEYLTKFLNRSICEYIGANKEYLKVTESIKDHILRNNMNIREDYNIRIKEVIKTKIGSIQEESYNVPELLFAVKHALMNGEEINEKYLIPSHYLTIMSELYDKKKNYSEVVKFADRALEKQEFMDKNIVFEIRYLLCLSLAKQRSQRFLKEVQRIEGADHNFLMAFYYRMTNKYDKALERLIDSLRARKNFTKAKRELVQVYLNLQEYSKAKDLAKQNFENDSSNPYHIQAYFACVIKSDKNEENRKILDELITLLANIKSEVAQEMLLRCKAQFEAFYNDEEEMSIMLINSAIDLYPKIPYPLQVKFEICDKFNRIDDMKDIIEALKKNAHTKQYYNNSIVFYEAVYMAKKGNIGQATTFVEQNLKNYTDEAMERVKIRLQRYNLNDKNSVF